MKKKTDVKKFFTAWQTEFPNFYTPKLKKVLQKGKTVVSVSAGHGAYEKAPTYASTPFKFVEGHLGGALGKPAVRGFKRLKGGKMFKTQVKARAYANKLLKKYQ